MKKINLAISGCMGRMGQQLIKSADKNKNFKSTLYSTIVSLNYYKGFSVINSLNNIETAEIIYGFLNKIIKSKSSLGFYDNKNLEISETYNNSNNIYTTGFVNIDSITSKGVFSKNIYTSKINQNGEYDNNFGKKTIIDF